jgi:hypothetical protein
MIISLKDCIYSCSIAKHSTRSLCPCEITVSYNCHWLIINPNPKTGITPIYEFDCSPRF